MNIVDLIDVIADSEPFVDTIEKSIRIVRLGHVRSARETSSSQCQASCTSVHNNRLKEYFSSCARPAYDAR